MAHCYTYCSTSECRLLGEERKSHRVRRSLNHHGKPFAAGSIKSILAQSAEEPVPTLSTGAQ